MMGETKDFTAKLNDYFETYVEIPRIKGGERQTIETLISEEALLFCKVFERENERVASKSRNCNTSN